MSDTADPVPLRLDAFGRVIPCAPSSPRAGSSGGSGGGGGYPPLPQREDGAARRRRSFSRSRSRSRSRGRSYRRRARSRSPRSRRGHYRSRSRSRSRGSPFHHRGGGGGAGAFPVPRRGADWDGPRRGRGDRRLEGRIRAPLDGPLLPFKQFLQLHDDMPVSVTEQMYERYKEDHSYHLDRRFFNQYKDDEWFQERYHPVFVLKRRLKRDSAACALQKTFEEDFRADSIEALSFNLEKSVEDADRVLEDTSESAPANEESPENLEQSSDSISREVAEMRPHSLFLRLIPSRLRRSDLLPHLTGLDGFVELQLSEPKRNRNFSRVGWIIFSSSEACTEALSKLDNFAVTPWFHIRPQLNDNPPKPRPNEAPSGSLSPARIEQDIERALELVRLCDSRLGLDKSNFLLGEDTLDSVQPALRRLNALQAYLRRVHCLCFYCGTWFLDQEDLRSNCAVIHRRHNRTENNDDSSSSRWLAELDKKLDVVVKQLKKEESTDAVVSSDSAEAPEASNDENEKHMGRLRQEVLKDFYDKNILRQSESKYRCGICSKLFKGSEFVEKHLANKHQESLNVAFEDGVEAKMFRAYRHDPEHPSLPPSPMMAPRARVRGPPPPFYPPHGGAPPPHSFAGPGRGLPPFRLSIGDDRENDVKGPAQTPPFAKRRRMVSYADLDAPAPDESRPTPSKLDYGLGEDDGADA